MIGVPPVAVICWRYSLPIVAAASVVVVMAGAAGSVPPPVFCLFTMPDTLTVWLALMLLMV